MSDAIESSRNASSKETGDLEKKSRDDGVTEHINVLVDKEALNDAYQGELNEQGMGAWEAAKSHPKACFWAFFMCFTIIMEAFDMFLNTNFVALTAFQDKLGVLTADGTHQIPTRWQSALFQSGQCGAFIGVFLAGPITTRIGYRWCTILALMLMNATIFISFFSNSLAVLTIGQAFEGVPWGLFIANSPAYASEIVPVALRGPVTGTLQMSWSIGQIIVSAVTYSTNRRTDELAWKIPLALQWMFPTPLLILLFFAPESPWWLARRGRMKEAAHSVKRLARNGSTEDENQATLAMIERTVKIEAETGGEATLLDLVKGTDLRRTIITCMMYTSQNFAGNLIANQATYFFEQAGMSPNFSFQLGLINTCLQLVANICFWFLAAFFGRRTIFLGGTGTNVILLLILGICGTVAQTTGTHYAQACLGVAISFVYAGAQGPVTYSIIAETSSVRLRALSTAVGRAAYYVTEIPMIYLASRMLNTTGWDLAGKCGYVWCGTAMFFWVYGYFQLPELKHRSYREVDIMFNRGVSARKFKGTVIELAENK